MEELPHTNNYRTVPTPGALPMDPIFGVVERRIDQLAEVTQPITSPSGFDHTFILGAQGFSRAAAVRFWGPSGVVS